MPDKMPEDMSDTMPEDLPVTKRIDVMVGITRSKVIIIVICLFFYYYYYCYCYCYYYNYPIIVETTNQMQAFVMQTVGNSSGEHE